MVRELIRVLISLRNVKTTVPIHILASGERYPRVEARLAALFPGIKYISGEVPPVVVPSWASKWARGSFAKLRALALTQFTKLLVLETASAPAQEAHSCKRKKILVSMFPSFLSMKFLVRKL